jgi:hypothetical protein
MKKFALALLLSLLSISPGTSAAMKAGIGLDMGLSAVFQFNGMLNLAVGNDGVAVDLLASRGASGAIGWYVGLGGWKEWGGEGDDIGLRIPVGLELDFASSWDVYVQLHPELRFEDDNGRNNNDDEIKLGVGVALGFRYLF